MAINASTSDSGVMLGYEIALTIDGSVISYGTSVSIDKSIEMIETTNKNSGKSASKRPGRGSYTVSFEGLNGYDGAGFVDLETLSENRTLVEWTIIPTEGYESNFGEADAVGFKYKKGSGFITSISASYGDQESSTYSCSLEGVSNIEDGTIA